MPESFQMSEMEPSPHITVIRVAGELTSATTPLLVNRCDELREAEKNLILTLANVSFIASNGIGGILATVESFKDTGLRVRLAALSSAVESVIKLLNLDQFLSIDPTEEESIAALG